MTDAPIPPELLRFLKRFRRYFIIGHREPDGDCVGSQMALARWLSRKGKDAVLCSAGPFARTEIQVYEDLFRKDIPQDLKTRESCAVVLDCSSIQRTGSLEGNLSGLPIAFIDHHSAGETAGEAVYIDAAAPSVTYMILKVIEASGDIPTREEAELLMFGLATDTGFFRHLTEMSSRVFETAARLTSLGASPKKTFSMMYGGKSLKSRKLMGEILSRTESLFLGKLLVSYETLEDEHTFGLESRDSDMLYQLLQNVSGCEAVVLLRQETETNCTVGFRSRESVDVAAIARLFGGGGHRQAAGLSIEGTIDTVRAKILAEFRKVFEPS